MQTLNKKLEGYAFKKDAFVVSRLLAASTAETITVPKGARYMLLAGTVDFWADKRTTAVIPAADIDNGNSPILIPGGCKELREVEGGSTFSVISAYVCIVTAEFYK